jgi:hypothetical protein
MLTEGVVYAIKAEHDHTMTADIILSRRYRDWYKREDLTGVYLQINPNNGFGGVTLQGRDNLRKLALAILTELGRDEDYGSL